MYNIYVYLMQTYIKVFFVDMRHPRGVFGTIWLRLPPHYGSESHSTEVKWSADMGDDDDDTAGFAYLAVVIVPLL